MNERDEVELAALAAAASFAQCAWRGSAVGGRRSEMDGLPLWFAPRGIDEWYAGLTFTLGEYHRFGDSFYLHVDQTLMGETDIFGAVARLLDLWLEELNALRLHRGETFLPFDFGDDTSLWLRVRVAADDAATVEVGASSVGGMTPSSFQVAIIDFANVDASDNRRAPDGFEAIDAPVLTCDLNALIGAVIRNRDELNLFSRRPVSNDESPDTAEYEWVSWDGAEDWDCSADSWRPQEEQVVAESPPVPAVTRSPPHFKEVVLVAEPPFWGHGTIVIGVLGVLLYGLLDSVLPDGDRRIYLVVVTVIAARVLAATTPVRDLVDPPLRLTRNGYHMGKQFTAWTDIAAFRTAGSFVHVLYVPGSKPDRSAKTAAVLAFFGVHRPPTYISTRYRTGELPLEELLQKWHRRSD